MHVSLTYRSHFAGYALANLAIKINNKNDAKCPASTVGAFVIPTRQFWCDLLSSSPRRLGCRQVNTFVRIPRTCASLLFTKNENTTTIQT